MPGALCHFNSQSWLLSCGFVEQAVGAGEEGVPLTRTNFFASSDSNSRFQSASEFEGAFYAAPDTPRPPG
jgi:hypothetical protein